MLDLEQLAAETANWFFEGAATVLGIPIANIPKSSRDIGKEVVLAALQKAVEEEREQWRHAIRNMSEELSRPKREVVGG